MKLPFIICWVLMGMPLSGQAQKFSPKWYGRAETKTRSSFNTYLCEMVIHKKGNQVTGTLNYFFGQQEHLVNISGIYWPQTKTIELNPFNLITFFAKDQNSPDCQVDGSLTLYTENGDSVLYGQLNPVSKYRNMCPILTISLHNETESDTGADPDLPVPEGDKEKNGDSSILEKPSGDTIVNQEGWPADTLHSSNKKENLPMPTTGIATTVQPGSSPIPSPDSGVSVAEFNKRLFQDGPVILAESDTIFLHLYDNGQVDNDTVSVFFNRKPIVVKQKLGVNPIIVKLVLVAGDNEIAMFAENLGDIPPNTALCLIFSGGKRYDINLVSNLATNGTVHIKQREKIP